MTLYKMHHEIGKTILNYVEIEPVDKFKKDFNFFFNPKISIIIPVFEEEKLLPGVLSNYKPSILEKYSAELIISDGGSTDKTVEISKKFTSKVVVHKGYYRQTIAEGRNRGAEIASGNILVFINGDTVPSDVEKWFSFILEWEENNPKEIALAFKVRGFPDQENWKDKLFYFFHNNYVRFLNAIGLGMGRGECQVVRKEFFWKVGGYNPKISAGEDFDLYRRLAKIGKIRFVDEICVYESPRRYRKYGYIRILLRWLLNGIFVMLFNKSFSNDWEPIR